MGLTKKGLAKVFRLPKRKPAPKPKPVGPAGHYDWSYMADMFLRNRFEGGDEGCYGFWAEEHWDHLFPYRPRRQGHFHPSAGLLPGMGCDRQHALDLICAPQDDVTGIDPKMAKILDNGTNRHIGLHVLFLGMAFYNWMGIKRYWPEVRVEHSHLPIEGTVDGVLLMDSEERFVIDFKTINDNGFARLYEPKDRHKAQLNVYMGCLGEKISYTIYENKNNQAWAVPMDKMRVDFDAGSFEQTRGYCTGILAQMAHGQLPRFDEVICKPNKRFCNYTTVCEKAKKRPMADFDHRSAEMGRRHLKVIS